VPVALGNLGIGACQDAPVHAVALCPHLLVGLACMSNNP
jgi:hypothetical protein